MDIDSFSLAVIADIELLRHVEERLRRRDFHLFFFDFIDRLLRKALFLL
jgi:hypothetical protein